MAEVTALKDARKGHKMGVTIAAKRLTSSLDRQQTDEIVSKFMFNLESVYTDFCMSHDDYAALVDSDEKYADDRVVNGLDLEDYMQSVQNVYNNAKVKFDAYRDEANHKQTQVSALPVKLLIESLMQRLHSKLTVVKDNIESIVNCDNVSSQSIVLLNSYNDEMPGLISQLLEQKAKLLSVIKENEVSAIIKNMQSLIQDADSESDKVKIISSRYADVVDHEIHPTTLSQPSFQDTDSTVNKVKVTMSSDEDVASHKTPAVSSGELPVSSIRSPSSFQNLSKAPIMSPVQVPSLGASGMPHISNMYNAPSTLGSTSLPVHVPNIQMSSHGFAYQTSPNIPVVHAHLQGSTSLPFQVPNMQMPSPGYTPQNVPIVCAHLNIPNSTSVNTSSLATVNGHGVQQLPASINIAQSLAHPLPSLPYSVPSSLTYPHMSYGQTTFHSGIHNVPNPYSSMYNVSNPSAIPIGCINTSNMHTQIPMSSAGYNPYGVLPSANQVQPSMAALTLKNVKFDKMNMPKWNGDRSKWPEFRSLWTQLIEPAIQNPVALAYQLKECVTGGEAKTIIENVWITSPAAYAEMWKRIQRKYDDVSAAVDACLDDLHAIKMVKEGDYRGLVDLVNKVESVYFQMVELGQTSVLTLRDVNKMCDLLPLTVRTKWDEVFYQLGPLAKVNPFDSFNAFLYRERDIVDRHAEKQKEEKKSVSHGTDSHDDRNSQSHHGEGLKKKTKSEYESKFFKCAVLEHRKDNMKHNTEECEVFKKYSLKDKLSALSEVRACFRCFENHQRRYCKAKAPCSTCGRTNHHSLMCRDDSDNNSKNDNKAKIDNDIKNDNKSKSDSNDSKTDKTGNDESDSYNSSSNTDTNSTHTRCMALYAISTAAVVGSKHTLNTFLDDGSNSCYITHNAAKKIKAKVVGKISLDVTTMGNIETTYQTSEYKFSVKSLSGHVVEIFAYGMERITGPVSSLDETVLKRLFPDYDPSSLQRKNKSVDMLLGANYFGLHPKSELCQAGDNLSIMSGELGVCLQGSHPDICESTKMDTNMVKTIHTVHTESNYVRLSHPEFISPVMCQNFILGEELGTEINPKCGKCGCGKCALVGHTYSFVEEQELTMIRNNLRYDVENRRWVTSYPWKVNPNSLPNNYRAVLATLRSTEAKLKKNETWAKVYSEQIEDLQKRGFARKLTPEEIKLWDGPEYYLAMLLVRNPESKSTPIRPVWHASQMFEGTCLNSAVAKGPDAYTNNLLGLILRWRERKVAMVGDIRKMYNSVGLEELEQHCHRFLWRNLDSSREPDVYVMTVVCMGDKPAGAIATEAIYMTADRFGGDDPEAASLIHNSTYVDDFLDSVDSVEMALDLGKRVEVMLSKGGFKIKCWQFSGMENSISNLAESSFDGNELIQESLLKGEGSITKVLGTVWDTVSDSLKMHVALNFSPKRQGIHTGPDLTAAEIPAGIPEKLTKRICLSQVMRIYDTMGILSPFTLQAKVYLRETWRMKLGWDDSLPPELHRKWVDYFVLMYDMQQLQYDRCLRPDDACGDPWLVILSDGSDTAYGFVAYIRWNLKSGGVWCRFILSKCRIAPVNKVSTPQMELNAAVLSKRGRKLLEKEMRFKFERILQIVDSDTVLCMINKISTRFNVYYGVRIGEIQAATDGDLSSWAWIPGKDNISDWLTRGRNPKELDGTSEWWKGPSILYKPVEEWGLRFGRQHDNELPGEKRLLNSNAAKATSKPLIDYGRFSSFESIVWVVARLRNIMKYKSFSGGQGQKCNPDDIRKAELIVISDIQGSMKDELNKKNKKGKCGGRYANLRPVLNDEGIYVVGHRLQRFNPMTPENKPQMLMPTKHKGTILKMKQAHEDCFHRARDSTLARFRQSCWTPHGSKLARAVSNNCQKCKIRDAKLLQQQMGLLPLARLKPSPAFNTVMIDLFGPYKARGEIQKRVTGKAYGVLFTDLVMRAVHIEFVFGYDTPSFLISFSRFTSIRGFPNVIYSDPGSQLIGAENELKEHWAKLDRKSLIRKGAGKGVKWIFGPADSPWHQGAVESLVKTVKRAIHISIHDQRLSVPELLTLAYEVANVLNERPIGGLPGPSSDINLLTPNSLLLGRATAKNPGGWQPECKTGPSTRYNLIQELIDNFWNQWIKLCAPSLVIQKKWHTAHRNLRPGDVVLIVEKDSLRSEYRIAMVDKAYPGEDGKVRKVDLSYKNYKVGEIVTEYSGAKNQVVSRSVQRLALIVPVDYDPDQTEKDLDREIIIEKTRTVGASQETQDLHKNQRPCTRSKGSSQEPQALRKN